MRCHAYEQPLHVFAFFPCVLCMLYVWKVRVLRMYHLTFSWFVPYAKHGHSVIYYSFGGGSDRPINIHEINCHGNESRLIDCGHEVYTYFYCHHSENVAIVCDGKT